MTNKEEIQLIVNDARLGKESAFKKLLNTYWSDVFRFQFSKTNDEEEAEDITIKTFAKAFDKIDLYNDNYNFKTWLISISKNIFLDSIRGKRNETVSLNKGNSEAYYISDDAPSPEDKIIIEQNLAELLRHIKKLKPAQQEIINLRYFQEYSYKEIAEKLNESMSSVKVKLLRSKKLLSEIIENKK
ncbi:RNA polymerase sigma factor [Urechidicola croceus]|uniref:RNA polymerase subunit sigma-70 n=1 Tax=Urechidicola croceus TaxID=1850246 RepID=A0A1D8P630_9FLAO|nr:sigma-70 family RNA polymerase sigma factor [Urechidicola croceus]AOW20029.1 RNA polymerase subunit sigma-70 [Urechidicola croceus]